MLVPFKFPLVFFQMLLGMLSQKRRRELFSDPRLLTHKSQKLFFVLLKV